eukprot:Partr_v1_DN26390_c0_g1_i1_m43104 putative serine threonine-protein kinase
MPNVCTINSSSIDILMSIADDGYRLTYGGYDFLALKAFANRGTVTSVGHQIGVGKESDVNIVANEEGKQCVLKIQRLGRISFRSIKNKRDYLQKRKSASWMYMSRLAAIKEYAFMKVLHENGFPVPRPLDQSRHCVVMELIEGFPLYQVSEVVEPGRLYAKLMELIVRLAKSGLIHGDFNEFNIMISHSGAPVMIDFPQMVSTSHQNADYYFSRDVECVRAFFRKRFAYESDIYPKLSECLQKDFDLDAQVAASGFTPRFRQQMDEYVQEIENDESSSDVDEELVTDSEDEKEDADSVVSECEELAGTALAQAVTQDVSDDDEKELENPENHKFAPHRDSDLPIVAEQAVSENEDVSIPAAVSRISLEDIRERAKRSVSKSQGQRNSARNMTKTHGKAKGNKLNTKVSYDG